MAKTNVNGNEADEAITYLKKYSSLNGKNIPWNFSKFLIDYNGDVVSLKGVEGFGKGSTKFTERWGMLIDDTDFRRDPRIGYLVKFDRWQWPSRLPKESSWFQYDLETTGYIPCLLYTSPSPRDRQKSRMPSSA